MEPKACVRFFRKSLGLIPLCSSSITLPPEYHSHVLCHFLEPWTIFLVVHSSFGVGLRCFPYFSIRMHSCFFLGFADLTFNASLITLNLFFKCSSTLMLQNNLVPYKNIKDTILTLKVNSYATF